jgi:hypothetical protein
VSNNPVLLDLFVAMQTKRIRVGQLGIVLPANNPIRVAEDIAMLDHMSGGRANAGFARGYQRRWVDVMAQQNHGIHGAQPHQHDEIDAANRAAFEESFQIVKRCWTEEMLSYDGRYWKIPPGPTPWDLSGTKLYGKGITDGVGTSVGVIPKPCKNPIHRCSSRSLPRNGASAGAPRKPSRPFCRCSTRYSRWSCSDSTPRCLAVLSEKAWACFAT